jgi:hypothetical protein
MYKQIPDEEALHSVHIMYVLSMMRVRKTLCVHCAVRTESF